MTITTVTNLSPQILQSFNPYLIDFLYGLLRDVEDNLIPHADKKIRSQDTGKRREFDKLLLKFREEYVRKKAEEADYKAKIKNHTKRSRSSHEGKTCRFTRTQS